MNLGKQMKRFLFSSVENERNPLLSESAARFSFPKRYIFSLMVFVACSLAISFNMNLSIAIISMVHRYEASPNNSWVLILSNETTIKVEHYNWSSKIESTVLGTVYYGQLVSFIPGGRLAELYGGKRILLLSTLLSSVFTLLSPILVQWNVYAFIVGRFCIGLGTGPIIPVVFYLLARWIPVTERSFHAAFILSGYGVGSFLAVIVSGAICGSSFLGGWPSVFYIGGFCGCLWCALGSYILYETPDEHPTITERELNVIMNDIERKKRAQIPNIPWKDMALSVPLWALAFGFFGQFWLLGFFSTVHALYMGTVIGLPIVKNGELSCLPHLLRAVAACICSYPIDIALKKKFISVGFVRKGATAINTIVSCFAFLGITIVGKDPTANAILFIAGGILGEFVTFGVCMACMDIAPNLSGTVSGIINIVGVFPFFLIPALVGWITGYEESIDEWKKVFYITIAVASVTTFIFTVFGDLKPQAWGTTPETKLDYEGNEIKYDVIISWDSELSSQEEKTLAHSEEIMVS